MHGHEARLSLFAGDRLDFRFCSPGWQRARRAVPLDELLARAREIDPTHCQRVVFEGSSPTEHPEFAALVRECRAMGLSHFSVETEGRALARPGALEDLASLGIEKLFVVCGGIRKKVYETVMQEPDAFREAMEGIHRASRSGIDLYVVAPVLRWTADDVVPLLEWLLQLDGKLKGLLLALPEIDQVPEAMHKVLLPYAAQAKLASRVFGECSRNRVEYGFASRRGITPCATGGALDRFGTVFHDRFNFFKHATGEKLERVAACGECSLANSCNGIERTYVRSFGAEEFAPVPLDVSMDWKLKRINSLEQHDYKNVSPFENELAERARSLLRINGHCNMSCSFCFVDRTVPDYETESLLAEVEQMARANNNHLVLSGGEPTMHPDLPKLISRAKELGFRTIEIQSNGVYAADPEYARTLADAGLNKCTVSLHSADPEHSDKITRLPGAFGKTMRAMHNFRQMGVLTQVAHVITKANYQELPRTVRFLREEFPETEGHLSICFAIAQSISDLVFTWVIPTFTEIKPYLRDALDYCLETGIGFGGMLGQGGYPPCMLDGEMKYYEMNLGNIYRSADHSEQFYKADRCRECSFDPYCVGVRRAYVGVYGDAEIQPFRADIRAMLPAPEIAHAPAPGATQGPAGLVSLRTRRDATKPVDPSSTG